MTKLTGVTEIVAKVIENWPSSHTSRLSALNRIFTNTRDWSKGYPRDLDSLDSRDEKLDAPLDETLTDYEVKYSVNATLLDRRMRRQKAEFVRAHADMIAEAESGEFYGFTYAPSFSAFDLNRIDIEVLSPAWKEALIEYCKAVGRYDEDKLRLRKKLTGVADSYIEDEIKRLHSTKRAAKEALLRAGKGSEQELRARATEIQDLIYKARDLGFNLVKIDAETAI